MEGVLADVDAQRGDGGQCASWGWLLAPVPPQRGDGERGRTIPLAGQGQDVLRLAVIVHNRRW
jgi:hypothetical protein